MVFQARGLEKRKLRAQSGIEWDKWGSEEPGIATVPGDTGQQGALRFGEMS